jgi:hypothetical protein
MLLMFLLLIVLYLFFAVDLVSYCYVIVFCKQLILSFDVVDCFNYFCCVYLVLVLLFRAVANIYMHLAVFSYRHFLLLEFVGFFIC